MDDVEILKATLVSTIERHTKSVQQYELEIANITAQMLLLQAMLNNQKEQVAEVTAVKTETVASKDK